MSLLLAPYLATTSWAAQAHDPMPSNSAASGHITVLNYNVHGLPPLFAGDRPLWRSRRIAPLLSSYQVIALQETFSVHRSFDRQLSFSAKAHARQRRCDRPAGPGLSTYSQTSIETRLFVPFEHCHGVLRYANDCLANKGLLLTRIRLPGSKGRSLDLYNTHLDAGQNDGDSSARSAQINVLLQAISEHSRGQAVVVVGDLNEAGTGPVSRALQLAGFVEACPQAACSNSNHLERLFFRSSSGLTLQLRSWSVEAGFVDERGRNLSDHPAVAVSLGWSEPQDSR
ncbi:MAG: hypothetical protein CMP23_05510 [Rickettsiales bacterium]|nr:hypothetical protein [Rickettsiales bacterium]